MQARELFLDADADNDGVLDVAEFTALLARISPKAQAASDAFRLREQIAKERLQQRIAEAPSEWSLDYVEHHQMMKKVS